MLQIHLSITQKKEMQADADRTELHEKELDQREIRIMLAYYVTTLATAMASMAAKAPFAKAPWAKAPWAKAPWAKAPPCCSLTWRTVP